MLEQNALITVPAVDTDHRIAAMLRESGSGALGGLQVVPVLGDNMEPTLRRGDFVFIHPVSRYEGACIYAARCPFGGSPVLHRYEHIGNRRVRVWSDNTHYDRHEITLDEFEASVVGIVVITANVKERRFLPDALLV